MCLLTRSLEDGGQCMSGRVSAGRLSHPHQPQDPIFISSPTGKKMCPRVSCMEAIIVISRLSYAGKGGRDCMDSRRRE